MSIADYADPHIACLQAAAKLSERQVQDMLYLWRMCVTRRGQLANERKSKLTAVPAESFSDVQMPNARLGSHSRVLCQCDE